MAFKEPSLNEALQEVLGGMSRAWSVSAELSGQLRGSSATPDILIRREGRMTVVVENEFFPANTVEPEARSRLGKRLLSDEPIQVAVALVSPADLRRCTSISQARREIVKRHDFRYAVHYLSGERFPGDGSYLAGSLRDLALFIGNASFAMDALEKAIRTLDDGVTSGIEILKEAVGANGQTGAAYADLLKQSLGEKNLEQILGIAATVIINAFVFQQRIASHHDVRNLSQMAADDDLTQTGVLREWSRILEINYWSIFNLAKDLLYEIKHTRRATAVIRVLAQAAERLNETGVAHSHDLAGVVFQRFITQRKYLASYYTRPESATLLIHLALRDDGHWGDENRYRAFKAADYACGTGTLIHSVYDRLAQLHEISGGDPKSLHSHMMSESLTGADIVPSAAHLTASMLSSVFPGEVYRETRIIIPEYGSVRKAVRLGSLELLSREARLLPLIALNRAASRVTGEGETEAVLARETPPSSQDLVIMNPPFTRAMSDWEKGAKGTWKQYRAFSTTIATQGRMKKREQELGKGTCYNGYQAMPSAFCAVADKMVKDGGSIALVLPLTSVQGVSWAKFRKMLATEYSDVIVLAITSTHSDRAWSADTNMAEVMVLARKERPKKKSGYMVSLHRRPESPMVAVECAREILRVLESGSVRSTLDGPYGGTQICVGGEDMGSVISQPLTTDSWSALGILDVSLIQVAEQLKRGWLWLPGVPSNRNVPIPIRSLGEIVTVGPADNNVGSNAVSAFDRRPISVAPTYPMLYDINSKEQTHMIVNPDVEGTVRKGREKLAERIHGYRSHAHLCRQARLTSQSLLMAFTKDRTIGGAWTTTQAGSVQAEKVLTLYGNSTLGLLQYWEHGARQQFGRVRMPVTMMASMPFLDVGGLSQAQVRRGAEIFDDLAGRRLDRIRNANVDPVRREIDTRLLVDVLGVPRDQLDAMDVLRRKFCAEPSVNGGKAPDGQAGGQGDESSPYAIPPLELPKAAEPRAPYNRQK